MVKASSPVASSLHIVVTCANRKRFEVPAALRLGHLRDRRPAQRFAAWIRRLGDDGAPTAPARDLYGGEHWQIASTLPSLSGQSASLWVCSAGYGFIGAHTPIRPYAATFASGAPDSVGSSRSEVQDWWHRLSGWCGPAADQPRSFADLARRDADATILAVLSDSYLRACAEDLGEAADELRDGDRLSVIGPPGRYANIDDLVVPVTASLRPVVGGSLQSLNVRTAAHLLEASSASGRGLHRSHLRDLVRAATRDAPPDPSRRLHGQRLTDAEVRAYIRSQRGSGPGTATGLLRLLRESGRSCEQSRFKHLFIEVRTEEGRC
jgi:hypothetical protein